MQQEFFVVFNIFKNVSFNLIGMLIFWWIFCVSAKFLQEERWNRIFLSYFLPDDGFFLNIFVITIARQSLIVTFFLKLILQILPMLLLLYHITYLKCTFSCDHYNSNENTGMVIITPFSLKNLRKKKKTIFFCLFEKHNFWFNKSCNHEFLTLKAQWICMGTKTWGKIYQAKNGMSVFACNVM